MYRKNAASNHKILLFILGGVLIVTLVPLPIDINGLIWPKLIDASHYLISIVLIVGINNSLKVFVKTKPKRYLYASAISVTVLGVIEIIQPFFGRSASAIDLVYGALGTIIGVLGLYCWQNQTNFTLKITQAFLFLVCSYHVLTPALNDYRSYVWRKEALPMLGNFEDDKEKRLWFIEGMTADNATTMEFMMGNNSDGLNSLRIQTVVGSYQGVSYFAENADWSGYRQLLFDIFNPEAPFDLHIRIDDDGDCDKHEDRYSNSYNMVNGWNRITIPLSEVILGPEDRSLNIRSIKQVVFFTGKDQPSRTFFLDYVRLK